MVLHVYNETKANIEVINTYELFLFLHLVPNLASSGTDRGNPGVAVLSLHDVYRQGLVQSLLSQLTHPKLRWCQADQNIIFRLEDQLGIIHLYDVRYLGSMYLINLDVMEGMKGCICLNLLGGTYVEKIGKRILELTRFFL